MPKHTSVSLYTRDKNGYHKTDPRGIYPADETTFALRYVGKDMKRVWETLPKNTDFATARKLTLEKELELGDPALNTPSLKHPAVSKPAAPAPIVTSLNKAIDRQIDSLWAEGELKADTITTKQTVLREFVAWAGDRAPDQIDRAVLLQYKEWLMKNGQAERTGNNKLIHLSSFLRFCGIREVLDKKDWKAMKKLARRTTKKPYTKAEVAALREAATVDERDVIEFLAGTGMRKGQCIATKWTDIDFLNRVARIPDGVGTTDIKKAREAKLGTELVARLQARRLR